MTQLRMTTMASMLAALVALAGAADAASQPQRPTTDASITRHVLAITYAEGPTISMKLAGTSRLPAATGEAKVERKRGMTEIEIELDEMKPATGFGGDYNTYVLWVVSPEGHVDNLGEFILEGNRSKLNVSTPLETFGMLITAEPHFLVDQPSRFVVLENTRSTQDIAPLKTSRLAYQGYDGVYRFDRESLEALPEAKGEVRTHLEAARAAVDLARRAGAERYAIEELARAEAALQQAEAGRAMNTSEGNEMLLGQEVVRLAVAAERLARDRAFEAALEDERTANRTRIDGLETAIGEARDAAQRATLEAERRALQAEMEANARREAQERAEEATRRAVAASQLAAAASRQAAEAEREAAIAQREREAARARLVDALARAAEVRETARGVIVNLPNILFDFNEASLKPSGREVLAKIAGIMQVVDGYGLSVEGHTDTIGTDAYNLDLSEARARSVRDYLVEQGVPGSQISARGFGESKPIAANDTAEGRQRNRRVEIVFAEPPATAVTSSSGS